MADTHCRADG